MTGPDGPFLREPAGRPGRMDAAVLVCGYVVLTTVVPTYLKFDVISVSLSDLYVLGLSVVVLCAYLTRVGMASGRNPVRTALVWYGVALLLCYGAAAWAATPPDELKIMDHIFLLHAPLLALAVLVCDGVRGRDRLDVVLKTMVVGCSYCALVGVLQFKAEIDLTAPFEYLPGLEFQINPRPEFEVRGGFSRAVGTTGTPIELGVLCVMVLPLAVHYALRAGRLGRRAWPWWICCLLLSVAMLFSLSRSAMLGLAAAGIPMFVTWPARRRLAAIGVGVVFMFGMWLAVPGLLGTLLGLFRFFDEDTSVSYRTHDYPVAFAEFLSRPLLGKGVGTWYAPKYQIFDNQYLLSLVETGILGLLAFCGLFAAGIFAAVRARRRIGDDDGRQLATSLIASLMVPLVGSVTFDLIRFGVVAGLVFVLLGSIGALLRGVSELPPPSPVGLDRAGDAYPLLSPGSRRAM